MAVKRTEPSIPAPWDRIALYLWALLVLAALAPALLTASALD